MVVFLNPSVHAALALTCDCCLPKVNNCFHLFYCFISDNTFRLFPLTSPHLAVLQGQFKHVCSAANETNSDAVQHHSFAAVKHQ